MIEIIDGGKPVTPFMAIGDRIRIEAVIAGAAGPAIGDGAANPFGAIDQRVVGAGAKP
jgi:hypothetical protein